MAVGARESFGAPWSLTSAFPPPSIAETLLRLRSRRARAFRSMAATLRDHMRGRRYGGGWEVLAVAGADHRLTPSIAETSYSPSGAAGAWRRGG